MGAWDIALEKFIRASNEPLDQSEEPEKDIYFGVLLSAIRDLTPIASHEYLDTFTKKTDHKQLAYKWLLGLPLGEGFPPAVTFEMCVNALNLSDHTVERIQRYAFEQSLVTTPLELQPGRQRRYRLRSVPFRRKRQACT